MRWQDHYASRYGFWRPYVTDVIYRYLECGDLHLGFARVREKRIMVGALENSRRNNHQQKRIEFGAHYICLQIRTNFSPTHVSHSCMVPSVYQTIEIPTPCSTLKQEKKYIPPEFLTSWRVFITLPNTINDCP
jgi:hypothetical protein